VTALARPASVRSVPFALLVSLCAAYALLNSGFDVTEGLIDLGLARRLAEEGRIAYDRPSGGILPGPDGRFYNSHELGNVLLLLPAVAAGEIGSRALGNVVPESRLVESAAVFLPCLWSALTAIALWQLLRQLGIDEPSALVAVLLFSFGTMQLAYSRMLFDGVPAGMFMTWAYVLLVTDGAPSPGRRAAAGALFGMAFCTRQSVAAMLPPVAWYLATTGGARAGARLQPLAAFSAGAAPFLVFQGWYNSVRTGSPFVPAVALPQYQSVNGLDGNALIGLLGTFFSPGKSIFLFSPVLVLAAIGARRFWRQDRRHCALILGSGLLFLLLHAQMRNWSGDWGWGPRYTVTILPLLFVPTAWVVAELWRDRWRSWRVIGASSVAVFSMLVQCAAVVINWHYRYAYVEQHGMWSHARAAWSFTGGQWLDAMSTAIVNVRRAAGASIPPDVVAGASTLNVAASNGVNLWWLTAGKAGVPEPLVIVAVGVLFGMLVWGARVIAAALLRSEREYVVH
jgi:hypothetical protein